jgi:MFS family permease
MASIVDIVQGPRVGVTIGVVWFSFALGGMVGPWLGGWLFELYGNYTLAFIVAIAMFLLACIALWVAAPRKSRRRLQALHP